jgi:uncharacterized protein (DUF2062 family)
MKEPQIKIRNKEKIYLKFRKKIRNWINRAKALHGDPHYIAMGMAIGFFVAITPTMPLQTIIAASLAFILKGSKAAAALATWISNPLTMPIFYYASYKAGGVLFGTSIPDEFTGGNITEILKLGLDAAMALIGGGVVIGILPGIIAYFTTRKIISKLRSRQNTIPLFQYDGSARQSASGRLPQKAQK